MAGTNISDQIKKILALKEDEEGNPVHYSRRTADRALKCMPTLKAIVRNAKGIKIGDPLILPYTGNSIDIYWTVKGGYDILANVKPDGSASYYGDFHDKKPLGGKLE